MRSFQRVVFLTFLLTQLCTAQWSWQNPLPQGNALFGLHFIDDNTGWITGQYGTIMKTTDGCTTWTFQDSKTLATIYAIQFLNSNTGYAVGDSGVILKTTNGGDVWNKLTSTYTGWIGSLHFINENYGWLGAGNRILATTNGGQTWQNYFQGDPFVIHSVFFLNETTGFWAGFGGLYKTTDGGADFNSVLNVPSSYDWDDITFINGTTGWMVGEGGKVAKTTDGGNNWDLQTTLTGTSDKIYFKDENNGWVTTGWGGLYRTQNGGNTWVQVNAGNLFNIFYAGIAGYAVGDGGLILKSMNIGETWLPAYQDITNGGRLQALFFNDPGAGFIAGADGKIFRSNDAGNSWNELNSGTTSYINSVFFSDAYNGWITDYYNIYKTTNSGSSWDLNFTTSLEEINKVFFLDSQTGWAAGDKIRKTTDGGVQWELQLANISELSDIFFTDAQNGYAVGKSGTCYMTTTGGDNWIKVTLPTSADLSSVKFYNHEIGWITGFSEKILKTTNGGTSWNIQFSGDNYSLEDICIIDSLNIWTAGSRMYKTTNGGDQWTKEAEPNMNGIYGISFLDKNNGWAVGDNGSIIRFSGSISIPSAPAFLNALSSDKKIGLVWIDNSDNENGFEIFRKDIYSGTYRKIARVNQNTESFTDSTITYPGIYWYRIKAFNENGSSAMCREDSAEVIMKVPETPLVLSPENGALFYSTDVTLNWSVCNDANYYHLQVSTSEDFGWCFFEDSILTDNTAIINGLNNYTTNYWRVRARNFTASSAWSEVRNFLIYVDIPVTPDLTSPPNSAINQPVNLTLSWNESFAAEYYQCLVAKDYGFTDLVFSDTLVTGNSIAIGPLQYDNLYYWKVRSVNPVDYSFWSFIWNFKTEPFSLVEMTGNEIPSDFKLYQNYPNPFNPVTAVNFDLPAPLHVQFLLYDNLGKQVAILYNDNLAAGRFRITINLENYPSGIYFYQLKADSFIQTKKLMLVK